MTATAPAPAGEEAPQSRLARAVREIVTGSWLVGVIAVVLAVLVGSILIAATDKDVQAASGYFFARPGDTLAAIWHSVASAYSNFFQGSIYNFRREGFAAGIKPLTDTLNYATPLIAAGLGIGLGFRAGLFNIGGQGQMVLGGAFGGWVGFAASLPFGVHPVVAVLVGMAAGALWGGIAGLLKAFTGAHEVIVTIMLNYVAVNLVFWMLSTPGLLQVPGSNNPKSPPTAPTAVFMPLFGPDYKIHIGFLLSIAATIVVWWLIERSSLGFRFRMLGENRAAALTAGVDVRAATVWVMVISGALVGLAGVDQVLGTTTTGFSKGLDAGIGFNAITVALLGRSRPWGVFASGILFGAFQAGGYAMQPAVQVDIVTVVQSLIVLFLAAPPLVRAMFRIPDPGARPKRKTVKA